MKFIALLASFCAVAAGADTKIDKLLPFATDSEVRVQAHLSAGAGVELAGKIVPATGGQTLWEGPLGTTDAAGEAEKVVRDLRPQLWSPGSPTLYSLSVTGRQAGKDVASQTVRFGFRSVAASKGQILLNGQPIFLAGIAIDPPGRDIPDTVGYSPKFAHDYVAYLRSQHVNLIRMTFGAEDDPRQQVWFDACDELGMLVDQGNYGSPNGVGIKEGNVDPEENPGAFAEKGKAAARERKRESPKVFDESIALYKKVFETYVRHPSVIIYILSNELPGPVRSNETWHDYLTRAYDRLHAWDPTRLFIGNAGYGLGGEGDLNDVHRYWGWYYNSFLTYYNLRDSVGLFGQSTDPQPMTFSECVGSFTSPLGSFNAIFSKQLAAQMCWTGHSPNQKDDALAYQAFMVKHALESFRTMREQNHRIAGLMPFTILFFNWEGISSFADMKPKPAMEQMGESYQPVLLSWEMWTPQVYSGSKVRAIAHVVNDAEDFSNLTGAKLAIEVMPTESAKAVIQQSIDLPAIPYFAAKPFPIELDTAALTKGDYLITGKIIRDGKVISHNEARLYVSPAPLITPTPEIGVYDPAGKSTAALERIGVKAKKLNDLAHLEGVRYLIVGEMALDQPGAGMPLKAFVSNGGRVLALAQNAETFDASWLPAKIEMFKGTATNPRYPTESRPTADQQNLNPERPWHPALTGVGRERLRLWSDYSGWDQSKPGFPKILPVTHGFKLTRAEDLPRTAVIIDYDRGLEGVALAEFFDGAGSVTLCGLDLIPRSGLDPIADTLLANLAHYLTTEKHETQPLVDGKIVWGNYPTERGVVTGPVNGLIYNCRWQPPPTAPNAKPMKDNGGAWNTHPGNPFIPLGVRPFGPFSYSTGSSPREDDKAAPGSGAFCCRIPAGRQFVVSKVQNEQKEPLKLDVSVNESAAQSTTIAPSQTMTIRTPISGGASGVTVRYAGDKRIVILETSFE